MDLLTPADIDALLAAHGMRASKALGQHFLADPNTARKIARLAGIGPGDRVLEIGPGIGSLTLALADTGAHVLALERDRHVLPILAEVLAGIEGVEVVEGDAMDTDWAQVLGSSRWSDEPDARGWVLVANLPYNIATPLLAGLLEGAPEISRMLVMIQREVGERLAAPLGTRASGAISVKVAYFAEASVVARVPPTVFVPRPRVESVLVRLDRRAEPPVEVPSPSRLFELVRAGFGQRRKMLRRALGSVVADAEAVLESAGIDPRRRAEELSLDEWARLARAVP